LIINPKTSLGRGAHSKVCRGSGTAECEDKRFYLFFNLRVIVVVVIFNFGRRLCAQFLLDSLCLHGQVLQLRVGRRRSGTKEGVSDLDVVVTAADVGRAKEKYALLHSHGDNVHIPVVIRGRKEGVEGDFDS
jgi:hypothetical protein